VIVVAGEALMDLILRPDGGLTAVPGGGPFNTARTIGRLGGQVAFLGRISSDRFGTSLRDALEADGVDTGLILATDAPTTLAVAELDAGGGANYRFHTAETSAPGLRPEDVLAALHPGPAALHLGTLGLVLEPMASALEGGVQAMGDGTLLMVDPNCRPGAIRDRDAYVARVSRILARADVVKVSVEDVRYLAPAVSREDGARGLVAAGAAVVLLTDGARPVRVFGPAFEVEMPVPAVAVVDTVGSGDAFGGAFLARWSERGMGRRGLADQAAVLEAVGRAIEVAGLTCSRRGADPPTRAEAGWLAP
jgi:fructokinase